MPAIQCQPPLSSPVVPGYESFAPIPYQKTGSMHGRIRKAPERVGLIGQEVGGNQGIFFRSNDLTADCAVGAAGSDSLHTRWMAWHHERTAASPSKNSTIPVSREYSAPTTRRPSSWINCSRIGEPW